METYQINPCKSKRKPQRIIPLPPVYHHQEKLNSSTENRMQSKKCLILSVYTESNEIKLAKPRVTIIRRRCGIRDMILIQQEAPHSIAAPIMLATQRSGDLGLNSGQLTLHSMYLLVQHCDDPDTAVYWILYPTIRLIVQGIGCLTPPAHRQILHAQPQLF